MRKWVLMIAAVTVWMAGAERADEVSLLMNDQPAKVGDYKCDDIKSLVMANGSLTITFGKDALGDFSATSLVKNGQELIHNLHGLEPRDTDHGRTFYFEYGASTGRLTATRIRIVKASPDLVHFAVIDDGGTAPGGYSDKPAPEDRAHDAGGQHSAHAARTRSPGTFCLGASFCHGPGPERNLCVCDRQHAERGRRDAHDVSVRP